MKSAGFKPEIRDLSSFQDDYGLKVDDGDDGDDEEENEVEGSEGYELIEDGVEEEEEEDDDDEEMS